MKVKIVTHYFKEDLDFCGDYESIDIYLDGDRVRSYGDSYHEKGQDRMEGFLDCLRFFESEEWILESLEIEEENVADAEW